MRLRPGRFSVNLEYDATQELSLRSAAEGWLPIADPPVGLVTWYAPTGVAMALVTPWLGVLSGHPPELRAGCCGRPPERELLAPGTDFIVNIPLRMDAPLLRELLPPGTSGCAQMLLAGAQVAPARAVHAPLLAGCALQIECSGSRILPRAWEPELAGDIRWLHRDHQSIDPAAYPDFCAVHPLRLHGPDWPVNSLS
jgi:hypothetical protein